MNLQGNLSEFKVFGRGLAQVGAALIRMPLELKRHLRRTQNVTEDTLSLNSNVT